MDDTWHVMAMVDHTSGKTRSTNPVIALTGAFGGGLTTAARHMEEKNSYDYLKLSDEIRREWSSRYGDQTPMRSDLQRLGDDLRRSEGNDALVQRALQRVSSDFTGPIVIESVKNVGEIQALREFFGYRLSVVAILSDLDARVVRAIRKYEHQGLEQIHLMEDDQRDRNEEVKYGQQVELCIDLADAILCNNKNDPMSNFITKIDELVSLLNGTKRRLLTNTEIYMHAAYSIAYSSKCLKRRVGALIVDSRGQIVAAGYNENPTGTLPCAEEPKYEYRCHRDIVRNNHFAYLRRRKARCPVCNDPITVTDGPPWRCERCEREGRKTNLESFYFPDRAMSWCTAVHAEVRAILAAEMRARGSTLYSTTFPCMQCAEKIIEAGIVRVVYTEAYPDPYGVERLNMAGIPVQQFEGVRSSAIGRLFPSMQS